MKFRAYFHKSTPASNGNFMLFSGELMTDAMKPRLRREEPQKELRWDKFWSNVTSFCGRVTVMQATGLRDIAGKEIFEGDVIRITTRRRWQGGWDFTTFVAVIELQDGGFWFRGINFNQTDCNWHFYNSMDREIVGNIHENPELLVQE